MMNPKVVQWMDEEAERLRAEREARASNGKEYNNQVVVAKVEKTDPIYGAPLRHWCYRLYAWFARDVVLNTANRGHKRWTPEWRENTRRRRMLRWLVDLPVRVHQFFHVVTGPKVDVETRLERMRVCRRCPARFVQLTERSTEESAGFLSAGETEYCTLCSCPHWKMSELKRKNRYANWKCPIRRHDGPYGDESYRKLLATNGGCVGCGSSVSR